MFKSIVLLALITTSICEKIKKHKHEDPFAALDHHMSHSLAFHYLWPWSQLVRAAAALDAEENIEEPKIVSGPKKFEVQMRVKMFSPDELRVKVKNRNIIVEGKHKQNGEESFLANHFVQRFSLPAGSKQEEVTAMLNEDGVLLVSVPKHELPPPPPEIEVPIQVIIPEINLSSEQTTEKKDIIETTVSESLDQTAITEATTHIGKIRKKELKSTTNTTKDNEVTKDGDGNELDNAPIETE